MALSGRDDGTLPMLSYGALGGAVAYVAGYLITYVWKAPEVADALRGVNIIATFLGIEAVPTWRGVGWLFYNAHFVRTKVPGPGGPSFVDFLSQTEQGWLLLVVIPVILIASGVIVASRSDASPIGEGGIHGAAIGVGYLPLSAGGALLTAQPIGETGARIAPDLLPALFLAGLTYPLLFGAVGGVIYAVTR